MHSSLVRFICFLATALPTYCFGVDTLCKPRENVYFACRVLGTGKVISLCGNSLKDREHFWLQYRFGTKENIELIYPRKKEFFLESGFAVSRLRRSNGFDIEVNFTNGGWSYTVFYWNGTPSEDSQTYTAGGHIARERSARGRTLKCSGGLEPVRYDAFSELAQMYENTGQ